MKKEWLKVVVANVLMWVVFVPVACANPENGYLQYQNPAANATPSTFSTVSYIFSLLFTFAIVVGLAYFTSKYLAQRWSPAQPGKNNMLIRDVITLGPNKALYLVDVDNKVLLLGATDHNIACLRECTDEQFIAQLRAKNNDTGSSVPNFQNIFQNQIDVLQRMSNRISGQRDER
jgi:flagellar protein FliO/FliZ